VGGDEELVGRLMPDGRPMDLEEFAAQCGSPGSVVSPGSAASA